MEKESDLEKLEHKVPEEDSLPGQMEMKSNSPVPPSKTFFNEDSDQHKQD